MEEDGLAQAGSLLSEGSEADVRGGEVATAHGRVMLVGAPL